MESCNDDDKPGYLYEIPLRTSDGWEVCSSNEVGLDSVQLIEMVDYLASRYVHQIHSIVIVKNDKLVNVLGAVIEKETGMSLLDFANECLFDPLNLQGGIWEKMAGGYYFASGGIYLRPRELTKIGYLFLNEGYWDNRQIITNEWISESIAPHIQTDDLIPQSESYGYQWWIMDFHANNQTYKCFFAAGWGDQFMFIIPDQEMIITINSGNFTGAVNMSIFAFVENHILTGLL